MKSATTNTTTEDANKALSVTQLTRAIKRLLEGEIGRVRVEGEISNWTLARSGHAYFNLKDENAQISCVMWASSVLRLKFKPADGTKVLANGDISVYEPRGQYQLVVSAMSEAGVGDLWKKFLELKARLEKEGLFDPARKKPLPALPRRVGIVTSPTGAAIRDVLNVLRRRFAGVEVFIWPCLVQGAGAAQQIAHGVRRLNEIGGIDVIIVCRGGGSIEDLWAFNEEVVARAIAASKIPIISGVGHETDFTIADFVADLRAPTPSAAAELVVRSRRELMEKAESLNQRLRRALWNLIERANMRLRALLSSYGMRQPIDRIRQARQRIDELALRMDRALHKRIGDATQQLQRLTEKLEALNPTAILERGYSIVTKAEDGSVVTSPAQVHSLEKINVRGAGGTFPATVTKPVIAEQGKLF
ncbi:MAG: exodeoxyribonuclease VII large subunit [Candidatus Sumerlaeota bacterium]|nr:exodeoxyribonuclease VII large subunit [Candidatus Sumerlaeota bacterium]